MTLWDPAIEPSATRRPALASTADVPSHRPHSQLQSTFPRIHVLAASVSVDEVPGEPLVPTDVAIAPDGSVNVADFTSHTILVFGADGRERARWRHQLGALACAHCWPTVSAASRSVVLRAVDDTYIVDWGDNPSPLHQSNASDKRLVVSRSDEDPKRYISFVRFDTAALEVDSAVEHAVLRMRIGDYCEPHHLEGVADYGAHLVAEAWEGGRLDGSRIPPYGSVLGIARPQMHAKGEWVEWDVTSAFGAGLSGDIGYGFAIDVSPWWQHSFCMFDARETDSPPELVITVRQPSYLPWAGRAAAASRS